MTKLNAWKMAFAIFMFCLATAVAISAQDFTSLIAFDVTNGASPVFSLVQGPDGNLYGATTYGGANQTQCPGGCGTVFRITPSGVLTTIYNFCSQIACLDGQTPTGVIVGPGGNLYGATVAGGTTTLGTVFKLTLSGQLTTLHNFCPGNNAFCSDGYNPETALVVGTNGDLYGTTIAGGSQRAGTIFEITPAGVLTPIYNFCSLPNCADGNFPAALAVGTDGNFYGTTSGNNRSKTFGGVFRVTPTGKVTLLHRFCSEAACADGANPRGGLVLAPNGNFYGTTSHGGANESSCVQGCGTLFEITRTGQLTTRYNFCSQSHCSDGEGPFAAPVLDDKGNLYGTTYYGGASPQCDALGCGTAFRFAPTGQFTSLYSFCSQSGCSDGAVPFAGLVLATNGSLYGTTQYGGTDSDCTNGVSTGCGTAFTLSKAAKPFVEPLPGFGIVGAEIGILGNKLTGASSVTFNGTPATFTVKSSTLIFASVPTGATTGYVYVTTANGTLKSNVPFRVMP
jgi:uncharacterized repeat protein (TIGR03803 family)